MAEKAANHEGLGGVRITLVCFHCGASVGVQVPHEPQFGFELAGWANDAGLLGVFDLSNSRALVFCNQAHADAERTRTGYRLRARGPGTSSTPPA